MGVPLVLTHLFIIFSLKKIIQFWGTPMTMETPHIFISIGGFHSHGGTPSHHPFDSHGNPHELTYTNI